jgi:hypothetical protein
MADDVFKQQRQKVTSSEVGENPLDKIAAVQQAVAKETGAEPPKPFDPNQAPFEVGGNVPPEFRQAMQNKDADTANLGDRQVGGVRQPSSEEGFETTEAPPDTPRRKGKRSAKTTGDKNIRMTGSDALEGLLQKLADEHTWEQFEWPSKGRFYENIPAVINIRAMTGEEEQILATPRWVKRGKAIDMIFQRCIKEQFDTEELLSVDRTHLLIYLRGISYTPEYDVEIKCPDCGIKFSSVINLNELEVDACPETFGPEETSGELPTSGFHYNFRLATGADEQEITNYRERRIQKWGDQSEDDTLLYRTALLLEDVEGVTMKKEIVLLLKRLPINDVAHLRNEINDPPFGVDTEVPMVCPSCTEEFEIDLPLETNFFFPRKKEERTPA